MENHNINKFLCLLLGFFIFFNFYIILFPIAKPPRVSDLLGIIILVSVPFRLRKVLNLRIKRITFLYLTLMILWLVKDFTFEGPQSLIITFRWLMAFATGLLITLIPYKSTYRYYLLIGMLIGVIANIIIIILQKNGLFNMLVSIGLGSPESWYADISGTIRYSGIFEYVNAVAVVISAGFAISLGIVYEYKKPIWVIFLGYFISAVVCALTYTRAPFIISSIILLIWIFVPDNIRSHKINNGYKFIVVIIIILLIIIFGIPGGSERWLNTYYLEENKDGRISSNLLALELLLQNPFGLGATFKEHVNYAVHNAFLQLGLMGGIPFLLFTIFMMVNTIFRFFIFKSSEFWLSIFLAGNFFFEEHLTNPTIIILLMWVLLSPRPSKFHNNQI